MKKTNSEVPKLKRSKEELQEYMKFKSHGFSVPPKKGRGSFKRTKKHKGKDIPCA